MSGSALGGGRARVLVTRPALEAQAWVAELNSCGFQAHALPLIEIAPPLDLGALRDARNRLVMGPTAYSAVMFVSPNAVRGFLGSCEGNAPPPEQASLAWAKGVRAWSPGPGTTRALRSAGWPAEAIDCPPPDAAQFDSEALWQEVACQAQPGARVLIVRGGDSTGRVAGRAWLAEQLQKAGVHVEEVAAYRRLTPVLGDRARELLQSGTDGSAVWLFSSSEAVANLCGLLPHQGWSHARAVATHGRIAQAARRAGFGCVIETLPTLQAVAASIESIP